MNSKQRIKNALLREKTDILPIVNLFDLSFLIKQLKIQEQKVDEFMRDPIADIVLFQEEINHDPIIFLYSTQEISATRWYNSFISEENNNSWNITDSICKTVGNSNIINRIFKTPSGKLNAIYRKDRFTDWVLEYPIKSESDLNLLMYRTDPQKLDSSSLEEMIIKYKDRAFIVFGISGVWQEACALRGLENMLYDLYDRPEWVKSLLEILCDYTCRIVKKLASSCVDCIMLNESQLGVGISRDIYRKYIKQYNEKIVAQINKIGALSSYHICGLCNSLLEDMAKSGVTCIEPLAPKEYSGDVDLKDAAMRVGSKVGLWGGFKERVLCKDRDSLKREVLRCKSEATGSGYVLRGAGTIYDARIENLKMIREFSFL